MAETMNMKEINIETFSNEVKMDLEDENYDPMMGFGKSGIGKTMSIYELTKELGIGFCELRLVTMSETDMLGVPLITDSSRTTYASNDLLPNEARDGKRGVLVLDEITSCSRTLRAAAYQLLDSKRALGNYKLPEQWKVIALGNGLDDGGVFEGMEAAFLSRAFCYRIEPDFACWKKWAIANNVNPAVTAYLTFDKSKLHVFDPDDPVGLFPCPRSWVALSKKLNSREKRNNNEKLPSEIVELYAAGAIGEAACAGFAAFYEYKEDTISPDDILSGKSKGSVIANKREEVIYLIVQQVVKQMNMELEKERKGTANYTKTAITRTANAVRWFIEVAEIKLDAGVTGLRDLMEGSKYFQEITTLCPEFDEECPELIDFATKHNLVFEVG